MSFLLFVLGIFSTFYLPSPSLNCVFWLIKVSVLLRSSLSITSFIVDAFVCISYLNHGYPLEKASAIDKTIIWYYSGFFFTNHVTGFSVGFFLISLFYSLVSLYMLTGIGNYQPLWWQWMIENELPGKDQIQRIPREYGLKIILRAWL